MLSLLKDSHRFQIGRTIRTNEIIAEHASASLLAASLPVNAKTYLGYTYETNTFNKFDMPTMGRLLRLDAEVGLEDAKFVKVMASGVTFRKLFSGVAFEAGLRAGYLWGP
jgi:outer membrane protein assembly factor BamA